MSGKDILMITLSSSPLIALILCAIVVEISYMDNSTNNKPSCYERAMDNRDKLDKKIIENDLNFIRDKIKQMIKEGKTYDYFFFINQIVKQLNI